MLHDRLSEARWCVVRSGDGSVKTLREQEYLKASTEFTSKYSDEVSKLTLRLDKEKDSLAALGAQMLSVGNNPGVADEHMNVVVWDHRRFDPSIVD